MQFTESFELYIYIYIYWNRLHTKDESMFITSLRFSKETRQKVNGVYYNRAFFFTKYMLQRYQQTKQ